MTNKIHENSKMGHVITSTYGVSGIMRLKHTPRCRPLQEEHLDRKQTIRMSETRIKYERWTKAHLKILHIPPGTLWWSHSPQCFRMMMECDNNLKRERTSAAATFSTHASSTEYSRRKSFKEPLTGLGSTGSLTDLPSRTTDAATTRETTRRRRSPPWGFCSEAEISSTGGSISSPIFA